MKKEIHKGVGLLIGNTNQTKFFVQVKDQQYPFEVWRGACSFWGGAIDMEDDNDLMAVERELLEELPGAVPILENIPKTRIDKYWVDNVAQPFWLTLFEAVVSDQQLKLIADSKVLEGYGKLISREELLAEKWIWKMDFIFKTYLKFKEIV